MEPKNIFAEDFSFSSIIQNLWCKQLESTCALTGIPADEKEYKMFSNRKIIGDFNELEVIDFY